MASYYIYIDDSGDPGLKEASSSNFVIASVVVVDAKTRDSLENALNDFRSSLGWRKNEELKFNKTNRKYIREAIRFVTEFDYGIYAMVLNKQKVIAGRIMLPEQNSIFLYVIKELLCELALSDAIVVIDGAYGPKYITKARTYIRQQLRIHGIQNTTVHFVDSKKSALVQLADLAAGSVARSLSRKEKDQEFIKLFGKKIKKIYKL